MAPPKKLSPLGVKLKIFVGDNGQTFTIKTITNEYKIRRNSDTCEHEQQIRSCRNIVVAVD